MTTRFALVTGSSRGIGRAIALELAGQGMHVAVHFHTRRDAAEQVLTEIRERGGDGFTVAADVTQDDQVRRMVQRVQTEFGALDVLVHNARPELADFYQAPLQLSAKAWHSAVNSQATAFLTAVQSAAPLCVPARGSSRSPTPRVRGWIAGSRGPRWGRRRPPWSRWCATSLSPWARDRSR
jgi:NAD(P)-dependent dehydrogenase (short-subunit alcohol dehydrogenase family)